MPNLAYLGPIHRTGVRLPMFVRDFQDRALDGAFHSGVFGRTGRGKAAFAARLMALQLRHPELSMIVFDPQRQFMNTARDLPVDVTGWARRFGHTGHLESIERTLRLPKSAPLLVDLLRSTRSFAHLTVKTTANIEAAGYEFERLMRSRPD